MTRIGIYSGTFSPPHNGHVAAARAFMEQMWLDYLYVIPTQEEECTVSAVHRTEMCRLAFAGIEGVCVSDMAIARDEKSHIAEILHTLSGEDRRLFLLTGTDTMLSLDECRDPAEIFRLSYPVYVRRETDPALDARIIEKISQYRESYGKVVRRIVTTPIEISSDRIRKRLHKGTSVSDALPPSVEKYILDNHLYV